MDGETVMVAGGQTARVAGVGLVVAPEAEVRPRAFSAPYKPRILAEAEACEHGGVGALLRSDGLFSSHLTKRSLAPGGWARTSGPPWPAPGVCTALRVTYRRVPTIAVASASTPRAISTAARASASLIGGASV